MTHIFRIAFGAFLAAILGCSDSDVRKGSFSLLSYNVAGLPQGLSASDPLRTMPLISPLLNEHDLVLVQEDFSYHDLLRGAVRHPHRSPPMRPPSVLSGRLVNDGLNRFSTFPYEAFARAAWAVCHGTLSYKNDCLAVKGFSVAETFVAPGVSLDVYNLHMDAGPHRSDHEARRQQIEQLIQTVNDRSGDRAVIVAGDTNLDLSAGVGDAQLLERLSREAGLRDACRSVNCGDEQLDRVLFRESAQLALNVTDWALDSRFVDPAGRDLSDHPAVATRFDWRTR